MSKTIVGKELVNYQKNGKEVKGVRLHCTFPSNKSDFIGLQAESFWCGPAFYDQAAALNIGDVVNLYCDTRGFLDTIMLVQSAADQAADAPADQTGDAPSDTRPVFVGKK